MTLCVTPLAVTLTATEYVPAGVTWLVDGGGGDPPDPPPAPAQLVTPANISASTTSRSTLRRRAHANGNSSSPQAIGRMRHLTAPPAGSINCADVACPVAICTVALPVAFAATASLVGLNVHIAFAGSVPHVKVNVPADPFSGDKARVYRAVCPLDTVWLDPPVTDAEKSNPIPDNGTFALTASMLLAIVRFPVCCPAVAGAKATAVVQFTPGASVAAQVVLVTWNPLEALSARSVRVTVLELVTVTICALLTVPTPVVEKLNNAGCICADPAAPPAPLNASTAGFANAVDPHSKFP